MQQSAVAVLKSKIRAPALPRVCIARTDLEERALADPQNPSSRLLYLSAPPGYGKTTVLCRLAQRFCGRTAWISLDPLDNDPQRLAAHLLAALHRQQPTERPGSGTAAGDIDRLMDALYTIDSLDQPLLLVFDDTHALQNDAVFGVLRTFLAYQPDNCRVAIASREDLPLPMYVHRQTDRLVEFRAAELRAKDSEASEFLTRLQVDLDPAALSTVLRKTAGWWSCLKLFAISWHQRPPAQRLHFLDRFRGTSRFIAEFLLESLVAALPCDVADTAGTIAVPDFFNEGLYTRLTGRQDYDRFVENLQRLNILGTRPGEGTARYRFHPLLRDYLRHRLPRSRRAELHRLTGCWFAENGFPDRASRHALLAAGLDPKPGDAAFSRRERELLQSLAQGLSNDEIAAQLFISTGTVKWHLNNIYGKLGAKSRTDALQKARSAGLLPA